MNTTHDAGPLAAVHLQWFAGEDAGAAGNPDQGSGEGAKGAGSFATDLIKAADGSPAAPAQESAPHEEPQEKKGGQAPDQELPGWTQATTKALRADPRFAAFASKFKSFDDAVKSAIELEAKIGGMVALPAKDAKPEEIAAFYAKLGAPETPEGYKLEKSKDLVYTDEDLKEYRAFAHKLHLSQDQAQQMFALINQRGAQELKAYQEKQTAEADAAYDACDQALRKEWGDAFDVNLEVTRRGMAAFGSPELFKDLAETGIGNRPSILRLFKAVGELVREDSANGKPARGAPSKTIAERIYG